MYKIEKYEYFTGTLQNILVLHILYLHVARCERAPQHNGITLISPYLCRKQRVLEVMLESAHQLVLTSDDVITERFVQADPVTAATPDDVIRHVTSI